MGRQQSLGKFFEVPASMGPPPKVQASLQELWKRPKSSEARQENGSKATSNSEDVKQGPDLSEDEGHPRKKIKLSDEPKAEQVEASKSEAKVKRSRIVDSEDDEPSAAASTSKVGASDSAESEHDEAVDSEEEEQDQAADKDAASKV